MVVCTGFDDRVRVGYLVHREACEVFITRIQP